MFFENADAYSAFRKRVAAALVAYAKAEREACPESPTAVEVARQNYCASILNGKTGALAVADQMLPTLAVVANGAGLIDEDGEITASDQQITGIISDALVDVFAGYVPEAA
jgi:hypothetical protein